MLSQRAPHPNKRLISAVHVEGKVWKTSGCPIKDMLTTVTEITQQANTNGSMAYVFPYIATFATFYIYHINVKDFTLRLTKRDVVKFERAVSEPNSLNTEKSLFKVLG